MRLSDAREEKNMQDWLDDKTAQKKEQKKQETIKYYESMIAEEIEGIKDCIDQGYFLFAQNKLKRILKYKNTIVNLNIN